MEYVMRKRRRKKNEKVSDDIGLVNVNNITQPQKPLGLLYDVRNWGYAQIGLILQSYTGAFKENAARMSPALQQSGNRHSFLLHNAMRGTGTPFIISFF